MRREFELPKREAATPYSPNPAPILAAPADGAKIPAGLPALPSQALHGASWLLQLVGPEVYARVRRSALRDGVETHAQLIAEEILSEAAYAAALGQEIGVSVALTLSSAWGSASIVRSSALPLTLHSPPYALVEATREPPAVVAGHVRTLTAAGMVCVLAPARCIAEVLEEAACDTRADEAVHALLRTSPSSSAASGWRLRQVLAPVVLFGVSAGGLAVLPQLTLALLSASMALPFLCVTVLRLLALQQVIMGPGPKPPRTALPRSALPTYTILVPLFRETEVLGDLVHALAAIDYPRAKLEVLLLIEAVDLEMQAALLHMSLPPHFRVVVVPDCQPRTKPKALNYALDLAGGDLVVVYDAEDRPQPSQLRHAAEVFARAPQDVGCVQARLNIYNASQSWFSRQFTIEYCALFDAFLPALDRLGLPVPLGGTSNHFRRETLVALGAWDPFNVTEDADLGIRLARNGYRTMVLASTTWEEAPTTFGVWLPQRTRWIKGWMQTWLVHTRAPAALHRDLGHLGAAGLHAVLGGLIMSALVQPLFYVMVAMQAWSGELFVPPETIAATSMMWIAWGNLTAGYVVSIAVGAICAWRRGRRRLALDALMMPFYWLLVSFAAYRALYQLVREPHRWEKTPHGRAKRRRHESRKRVA